MSRRVEALSAHMTASASAAGNQQRAADKLPAGVPLNPYLVGNFRPTVNEGHYGPLKLAMGPQPPAWLKGQFLRIGPNPKFSFEGKPYHAFDGDGFVHGITFVNSVASYTKRYVRTHRLVISEQRGFDVAEMGCMAVGDYGYAEHVQDTMLSEPVPGLMRTGKANTNVVAHAGRVLALEEADVPYEIVVSYDGESNLRTVGRFDFHGRLKHVVTAHPKVDPVSGEMVFFGYDVVQPKVAYSVVDKNGVLVRDFEIPLPCGTMMHDMVIAGEYSLLFDQRLEFQLERLSEGKNPWVHRGDLPARFGVLPRLATSADAIKWIDVAPCSLFHFANAWVEKDGTIVVVGSRLAYPDFMPDMEVINKPKNAKDAFGRLHEWRLDPRGSGKCVSERRLFEQPNDFVQVDPEHVGQKNRYVYSTRFIINKAQLPRPEYAKALFLVDALVKYDLETGVQRELPLVMSDGEQAWGGEAVFAANPNRKPGEEDNGLLIVFGHDEKKERTQCLLIDAAEFKIVSWLDMPERVPYGFHATWVADKHMR